MPGSGKESQLSPEAPWVGLYPCIPRLEQSDIVGKLVQMSVKSLQNGLNKCWSILGCGGRFAAQQPLVVMIPLASMSVQTFCQWVQIGHQQRLLLGQIAIHCSQAKGAHVNNDTENAWTLQQFVASLLLPACGSTRVFQKEASFLIVLLVAKVQSMVPVQITFRFFLFNLDGVSSEVGEFAQWCKYRAWWAH